MKTTYLKPENLKVLILGLGLEEWKNPDDKVGNRDVILHEYFKKIGVKNKNNILIGNEKGTRKNLNTFVHDFLCESNEDSIFIFYYAGHGVKEGKENLHFCHLDSKKKSYTFEDFIETIASAFEGKNVIFMADCCHSGVLSRFCKNQDNEFDFGMAGLASAQHNRKSTETWAFTDAMLEVLQGKTNWHDTKDNSISFEKLTKYVRQQMREKEHQKIDVGFSKNFDKKIKFPILT